MELPIRIVSVGAVKRLIARTFLADEEAPLSAAVTPLSPDCSLGSITLKPHQISAFRRLGAALDEFGGALLSDEVGMGKTFVALAVAKHFPRRIVLGPAVLRDMWSQQGSLAQVDARFISFESLSRGRPVKERFDLIVIDEAHHLRNPATRRYRALARMARRSRVLMLSATPFHNKRRDLTALLSIFLGSRAGSLTASEIGRCVVRRQIESTGLLSSMPETRALVWKEVHDDARIPDALLSLPPPVPVRDGGDGGVLVARSLLRQWCSSDAALEAALRRRLARSIALRSALEAGHYPSQHEMSAWTMIEDSVQLAFPSLVATGIGDATDLLVAIQVHESALRELLGSLDSRRPRDVQRASVLKSIRSAHPEVPIVAFSQYTDTVNALFNLLRHERGVAVLTSKGARVAGGSLTRREAISRFAPLASGAPQPRDIERVSLLLATDLLSEGVNLQDAGVVVHLDLPWTPARLEQRMGRVARMGSAHLRVYAYGIRPSAAAETLIRLEDTIRAKMAEAEATVGAFRPMLPADFENEASRAHSSVMRVMTRHSTSEVEQIRTIMQMWLGQGPRLPNFDEPCPEATRVTAVRSVRRGFLAVCASGARRSLLAHDGLGVTDQPNRVLEVALCADGDAVSPRPATIDEVRRLLVAHFQTERVMDATRAPAAGVAQTRRAALRRLSRVIQGARPHARSDLLKLAPHARSAILGRLGAAAESELIQLASAELPDEKWLRAVGGFAEGTHELEPAAFPSGVDAPQPRVVAILILQPDECADTCGTSMR